MDLQELEKVTVMINSLGDKALDGFTLFIGANFITNVISYGVGVLALVLVFKLVKLTLNAVSINMKAIAALCKLRTILKVGCAGTLVDSEIDEIVKKVTLLIQCEKNNS